MIIRLYLFHFIPFSIKMNHIKRKASVSVGSYVCIDPVGVFADFGVDSRIARQGTTYTPGDNALEHSITNHGATRISLKGKKD